MRKVIISKTWIEKFNTKRAWFVRRWRITDLSGDDLAQPYFHTLKDAKEFCKGRYTITEVKK